MNFRYDGGQRQVGDYSEELFDGSIGSTITIRCVSTDSIVCVTIRTNILTPNSVLSATIS